MEDLILRGTAIFAAVCAEHSLTTARPRCRSQRSTLTIDIRLSIFSYEISFGRCRFQPILDVDIAKSWNKVTILWE
jgi:hypothetical protein